MHDQELVEGWTEPVRSKLLVDGAAAPVGKVYKIHITDKEGETRTIDTNGATSGLTGCALSVATVSTDTVAAFTPVAGTLVAADGPYRVRYQNVTDGYYLPNSRDGERWLVRAI
jgi:hypothetical protein